MYGINETTKDEAKAQVEILLTEAKTRIEILLTESEAKIIEAQLVADEYGLMFEYEPRHVGLYQGKGYTGTEGYLSFEDTEIEGQWFPSEWNSSSIYC